MALKKGLKGPIRCSACHEKIYWTIMPSGNKMRLNRMPEQMVQIEKGMSIIVKVYRRHWETCPDNLSYPEELEK